MGLQVLSSQLSVCYRCLYYQGELDVNLVCPFAHYGGICKEMFNCNM